MSMRLKNLITSEKKKSFGEFAGSSADSGADSSAESSDEISVDETSPSGSTAKECFENLKYVMVNSENRLDIEIKLKSCRGYRNELLKIDETDLLESFPYFFADPTLVGHYTLFQVFYIPYLVRNVPT